MTESTAAGTKPPECTPLGHVVTQLAQHWPTPSHPRPIVVIGAGGIVNDAHLPAYRAGGLPVGGIFDLDLARAQETARRFEIPVVHRSLEEAMAAPDAVFDLAVPPDQEREMVAGLPRGATVLLQKPMGHDLADARAIRHLCRERQLTAAVNFQLRFSPMMLAVRDALQRGLLGDLLELEVRVACRTPWENWPFMATLDHVEVPMHSIHYLDWIRSVLGEPRGVLSLSVAHPGHPALNDSRTSTILDFGDRIRCCLSLNHTSAFGPRHDAATIRLEGTEGAATMSLGVLLNYPDGEPETLEIVTRNSTWTSVPLSGRWFPDAFLGVMSNLQRFTAGEDETLETSVEDAIHTMSVVDACGRSSHIRGIRPDIG